MTLGPIVTSRTNFGKGIAKDEAGTLLTTPRDHRESFQRGGCSDGHRVQTALSGDDTPPSVEQVFWQSGRSFDSTGVWGERERQNSAATPGRRRAGIVQPGES